MFKNTWDTAVKHAALMWQMSSVRFYKWNKLLNNKPQNFNDYFLYMLHISYCLYYNFYEPCFSKI
jgi:hypothetical protein